MSEERRLADVWQPRALSIFRFLVGLLYMEHGLNKFINFPPNPTHHPYVLLSLNPGLTGIIETFGGLLLALGLFTRWAAFIMSGEMAVAYFMVFVPRGGIIPYESGASGVLTVLYSWVFFYLFVAGGGPWSLDRLLGRR